jgi:hypothetical protein
MCMCQIFLAVGGGTFILIEQVAVLAAASHEDYAVSHWSFNSAGRFSRSLPGSVLVQIAPETLLPTAPARTAIQNAYAFSQRNMMIAGTAVMGLSIAWVLMILYTNRLGHQVEERYLFSEPVYVYPPTPLLFSRPSRMRMHSASET